MKHKIAGGVLFCVSYFGLRSRAPARLRKAISQSRKFSEGFSGTFEGGSESLKLLFSCFPGGSFDFGGGGGLALFFPFWGCHAMQNDECFSTRCFEEEPTVEQLQDLITQGEAKAMRLSAQFPFTTQVPAGKANAKAKAPAAKAAPLPLPEAPLPAMGSNAAPLPGPEEGGAAPAIAAPAIAVQDKEAAGAAAQEEGAEDAD